MACYATSPTASFLSAHRKFSWLKAAMHVSNEVVKNVRVGSLIKSLSRLAKSPEEINYRKKCSPLRGQLSRTDRKGDGKLGYNFTASLFICWQIQKEQKRMSSSCRLYGGKKLCIHVLRLSKPSHERNFKSDAHRRF